jgi:hypothetical protein
LLLAAAGDDHAAEANLGLLAKEHGDRAEAERWLRQGAEGGDVMAATELRRL